MSHQKGEGTRIEEVCPAIANNCGRLPYFPKFSYPLSASHGRTVRQKETKIKANLPRENMLLINIKTSYGLVQISGKRVILESGASETTKFKASLPRESMQLK